ncbi:hypothetical protein VII00023_14067 [Vibrio ichthyoenteri ATCC 700023]|uniref:1-pyrroline-5-carboxylate dehydrogenase n=1 Tax=Vibrio ichthyoenteri ATCC 700023 TaxID=870968 RepID=F9S6I0_9VIBR|nr:hypothetical protein [Vibrio ichthyoenteri]EGU33242.1 hypothetical protein VII00023_14067 [Vibrio ichthyoenteri ATCC 700023]
MLHQVIGFSDAFSAWENWNLTDFDSKTDGLLGLKSALAERQPKWAEVVHFHIEQAATLIGYQHQLMGPTGESNELYTAGRGVSLLIMETEQEAARYSLLAQLTAALIAGNSVLVCSDDLVFVTELEAAYKQSSLPINLIQFAALDAVPQVLESDVRLVGFVGSASGELNLNRQLASRQGAIVCLVSETDLVSLSVAHDPHLSLRFITERTRTINITAVGGNATLLGAANL